jgi:hypothetical protein
VRRSRILPPCNMSSKKSTSLPAVPHTGRLLMFLLMQPGGRWPCGVKGVSWRGRNIARVWRRCIWDVWVREGVFVVSVLCSPSSLAISTHELSSYNPTLKLSGTSDRPCIVRSKSYFEAIQNYRCSMRLLHYHFILGPRIFFGARSGIFGSSDRLSLVFTKLSILCLTDARVLVASLCNPSSDAASWCGSTSHSFFCRVP